ncbi:hypothetical protein GOP47_0022594 [Adiantum capillus-veneris]|uniref:DUF8003 domain-containing protein n=1 Tax=Adiantum capillus-veneris TaxID=13818 RepID=A0A9D4U6K7_ADICA|nr:hypothetical protein GOP47_0022594 [Adiantum capillus-veneris]
MFQIGSCALFQDLNTGNSALFTKLIQHNVCVEEPFSFHEGYPTSFLDITNDTLSCEDDLGGFGSLDGLCTLNESIILKKDAVLVGDGSLILSDEVCLSCPVRGCTISINLSGEVLLEASSSIVAGTIMIDAENVILANNSSLNTTALAGSPPPQTSGTPLGLDGAGGGHGGRGAFCVKGDEKDQEDAWGGDVYSWSSLSAPWSYGSQGGTTSREEELGGGGGGRVLIAAAWLNLDGALLADGGYAGINGGGGSGGSILIKVSILNGTGEISASGGTGWAGGGGGRVSVESKEQEGVPVSVHGGDSLGCTDNAGAAGTRFDVVSKSLVVSNSNKSTQTDTIFMEFPTYPLWENVYVENYAKVAIPLLWSRVQVQGQIILKSHATLSSGLAHYPFSEFELVADELDLTGSTLKVYGALRLSVKVLRMRNSILQIDGGGGDMVATSIIDASNLVLLQEGSTIGSNSNLGVHGQGFFHLKGQGDAIKAQRLFVSLFYNVNIGSKAVLQAPLTEDITKNEVVPLYCDKSTCPIEITQPPEDCNLNTSLPFTLQICRVEDVVVDGLVKGSVVHIHRARTVTIHEGGLVTASGHGCQGGIGKGELSRSGAAGGAGHGGKGGRGYYNGSWVDGGKEYGSSLLPCELGSGSGNITSGRSTHGGGVIVIGSLEHALSSLEILGAVTSDGESFLSENQSAGVGGGSGGSLLFFLQTLTLGNSSSLSISGGKGSAVGGGGGAGGRIHFHWSNIATGDDYIPIANVKGSILLSGGSGNDDAVVGGNGTVTGKDCPPGLFGVFCKECPVGFYKEEHGSDASLCKPCLLERLPQRANFTYVRGGVTYSACPYKCVSDKYRMPYCYTPLQELIYTFGGPWIFGLILVALLVLLALVLSVARVKLIGTDELSGPAATPPGARIDHSLPFLESLNEVLETARAEESQNHVYRLYFMGNNSFSEPWHLPYTPPKQIMELIYEDAFNRFVDEINSRASYQWWEGAVHGMLAALAYPLAYTWKQWCRRKKVQQLREYVRSGYDHSCLRSCRSRALYEGLKVAATPDLMLAYIDFMVGGDEKRPDLPPPLLQRLPLSIIFGGDGSYMAAYYLHSDNLLTSLLGQAVPATIWYRLVAGLNAQLRTVRRGCLRRMLLPVIDWLTTHANPCLSSQGVHIDLAWFQPTPSGSFQLGLVVSFATDTVQPTSMSNISSDVILQDSRSSVDHLNQPLLCSEYEHTTTSSMANKKTGGGLIDNSTIKSLNDRKGPFFPLTFVLRNVRPFGHQDVVGLIISILLLGDFSLTLLTLLQFYSISIAAFLIVLLILPLASFIPFFTGIFALFSHGPQSSADHTRIYALWNVTSIANTTIALLFGLFQYKFQTTTDIYVGAPYALNFTIEEGGWWMFPGALFICKIMQARMLDRHIANLEVRDRTVYSKDPAKFWDS